jgi:hypothetical protein
MDGSMKVAIYVFLVALSMVRLPSRASAAETAIQSVTIGENQEFRINGKPFFPILCWLQNTEKFSQMRAMGVNTVSGYWREANGTGWLQTEDKFGEAAWKEGLYFIPHFDSKYPQEMEHLKGAPYLLAWLQRDEPDLPQDVSDVKFTADKLSINQDRPLSYLTDGNPKTSSVLSPMVGAEVTIRYPRPATVTRLALGNGPDGAKASEVEVWVEGKLICQGSLPNTAEMKSFDLAQPVTLQELTLKIPAVYETAAGRPAPNWGTFTGIDGFDATGNSVLRYPDRKEPALSPMEAKTIYEELKKFDPSRPMLVTFSAMFLKDQYDKSWYTSEEANALYPGYVGIADVYAIDIYPIYGWNRPGDIDWVSKATKQQQTLVGPGKPLVQWIETCTGSFGKNSKPVTDLEIRNEVYQAVASGCTAIGYFTHVFKPAFSSLGTPPENQIAIKKINAELDELAPQLLGPDAKSQPLLTLSGNLPSLCRAKSDGKSMTVIALNMDGKYRSGSGTIRLAGLNEGTPISVYGENRTITATTGQWKDDFAPLAVHIYQLNP